MRAYFITNMYLSSIQNGIQPAHCVAEMFTNYMDDSVSTEMLYDWARNHKTMVVLNGGYSSTLWDLEDFFQDPENYYPWAAFKESDEALDGALTVVGIILPERVYEHTKSELSPEELTTVGGLTIWEAELVLTLRTFGLAK